MVAQMSRSAYRALATATSVGDAFLASVFRFGNGAWSDHTVAMEGRCIRKKVCGLRFEDA